MTGSSQQLPQGRAEELIQAAHIEELSGAELLALFQAEDGLLEFSPQNYGQVDPRSNDKILFNPQRAKRPNADTVTKTIDSCPICDGHTTRIIDYTALSEGFTFINKNLYPAMFPHEDIRFRPPGTTRFPAWGMHFLQWTSSFHEQGWHNMAINDLVMVLARLGALEKYLLTTFAEHFTSSKWDTPDGAKGHVSIIKNGGLGSGGSLSHDHQQIIFSNALPRRIIENMRFEEKHGKVFSKYILEKNPASLVIRDIGEAVLLVPYFMRRPYNMLLVLKDTSKQHVYQLTPGERASIARGWKAAIQAIHGLTAMQGSNLPFNVITHNGVGAGLYFEFLPRSQTEGGFELIGFSVCQSSPDLAAEQIRQVLM